MKKIGGLLFINKFVILFFLIIPVTAFSADIFVKLEGVKSEKGEIVIQLYSKKQKRRFPDGKSLIKKKVSAFSDLGNININDVGKGEYAISVYHDINSNGKIDLSSLGIPKEPYGNSGTYSIRKPRYSSSKFIVTDDDLFITIKLH